MSEVKFWLDEAKKCEDRQKIDLIKRNSYPFLLLYYEGVEKINALSPFVTTAESYAIINEYFPNTNAKISELIYKYPDIVCQATKPDAESNENLMKSALDYGFKHTDALIENRVALFDMLFAGYCAVEVDHIIDEAQAVEGLPDEQQMTKNEQDNRPLLQKAKDLILGGNDETENKIEAEFPRKEEAYSTNEKTYIRRWNPCNVPLDHRANVLRERRYNLKRIELSQSEFNARYPKFKDKVRATDNIQDFERLDQQDYKRKVLLYEFQIKKKNNEYWNIVVSKQSPTEEIDCWKRPYITNGFNMKIGTLHKYGVLYPISFAQINKKMQDEMNHYVKFLMECAERTMPKYGIDKNRVKEDGEEALKSAMVNDLVRVDGQPAIAIQPISPSIVSRENKEMLQLFTDQKQKLWNVSQSKLSGISNANFATEVNIQEMGMLQSSSDVQEGLRLVMKEQIECLKDIVINFWDGEYFFKVTGGQMPQWYIPQKVLNPINGQPLILNPLTDILTGDYELDIDILSAMRPNREQKKKETVDFLTWCINILQPFLMTQGKTLSIDELKKAVAQFGQNPDTFIVDLQQMGVPPMGQGGPLDQLPPEIINRVKTDPRLQERIKNDPLIKQHLAGASGNNISVPQLR
jgi:hypothetical protein